MNEQIKHRLQQKEIWLRVFYMLFFVFIYGLSKFLLFLIIFFQFIVLIINGKNNSLLLQFSQSLCTYIYQIILFLSFNSEERPFPFKDWPGHTELPKNE